MPRSAPWLLTIVVLATSTLVACAQSAHAAENGVDPVSRLIITSDNKAFLADRLSTVRDYAASQSRGGLLLSTTVAPSTGRLLIARASRAGVDTCSGVAIGGAHFLTAAHCLCKLADRDARTAEECRPYLPDLRLKVFLPAHGLFAVTATPVVHPEYRSPSFIEPAPTGAVDRSSPAVADLALVRFEGEAKTDLPALGAGEGRPLLSSHGTMYFALEEYAERMGFEVGRPIAAGVGQVSRPLELRSERSDCGRYHAADTMCSLYNPVEVEDGPLQTTTVCQGDSGAPLYRPAGDGRWSVVGIVSYFSPPNSFDRCDGGAGRRTHYTDLAKHRPWLTQHLASPDAPSPGKRSCVDGVFRTGAMDLLGFKGLITVTGFNKRPEQGARHAAIAGSPEGSCARDGDFGVVACRFEDPSYVGLDIQSDFAQVTICPVEK